MNFTSTYTIRDDGICIITPKGRLNAVNVPDMKKEVSELFEKKHIKDIIIDMSQIDFIDSSGLSLMISFLKRARESEGFFRIAAISSDTVKIFKLTLLDRVFEMYATVDEALTGGKAG
jgi:anti-anti-sigma factor